MSDLLTTFGEDRTTTMIGPLAVDGLMVVAGLALLATGAHGQAKGIHVVTTDPLDEALTQALTVASTHPRAVTEADDSIPLTARSGTRCGTSSSRTPRRAPPPKDPANEDHALFKVEPADPLTATARDRFAEFLATGATPSIRVLRPESRIGHPRAIRMRHALAEEVRNFTQSAAEDRVRVG